MQRLLASLLGPHDDLAARHFELHVLPAQRTMSLTGYAMLRRYEPVPEGERYAGGESRQVKRALQALVPSGERCVVEVRLTPAMERQRESTYPFFISQAFETEEALETELRGLRAAGFISDHTYPIRTPTHEGEEA